MKTEVRNPDGRPTLFVDGEPHHGIFSSSPAPYMKNLLAAGFDVIDTHPYMPLGWNGPERYDYTLTDERMESYLKQSPSAKLIVRFWLGYDAHDKWGRDFWWCAEHPEENILTNKGPERRHHISFASTRFRQEAGEALRRVVEHLEEKYGERILAFVPGGGPCGEWFHWYAYHYKKGEEPPTVDDYSAPMQRAYRNFLAEKYGSLDLLNRAWSSAYAGFGEIPLPSVEARFTSARGALRAPAKEQALLDFYEIYNRVVADTLLHWAAKTKEGCRRKKAVLVFYGYLWHNQEGTAQARGGHVHLDTVLKSPDVDGIVAPFHYSFRQLDGVFSGQAPVSSPIRRGKLYVHELDGSTCLMTCWPCPKHHNPEDAAQTGALFRRELGKMLCEGSTGWYMDLMGGFYDRPDVVEELRKTLAVGRAARPETGRNNRHVAAVLQARNPFYFREGDALLAPLIAMFKQFELERMGLGYDDLILEDLDALRLDETERYRVWIFPGAVRLSERELSNIRRHACRNGNHVIWNYGVGVCEGEGLALERMEEITGFQIGFSNEPGELAVTVRRGASPYLKDLPEKSVYGTYGDLSPDYIKYHAAMGLYPSSKEGFQVAPRFFIRGGQDETLGTLNDLPGHPAGLALKKCPGWVSILSCAPLLPKAILRAVARVAGGHVYTDFPGQTWHCENHVALFFHDTGRCAIHLPRQAAKVTELYEGKVVGEHTNRVVLAAEKNRAVLLRYE